MKSNPTHLTGPKVGPVLADVQGFVMGLMWMSVLSTQDAATGTSGPPGGIDEC